MPHLRETPAGSGAPVLLLAGAALLAAATVAGAWLARRCPGQRRLWLGAAAGALPVIAGVHVLPDARSAARAVGGGCRPTGRPECWPAG